MNELITRACAAVVEYLAIASVLAAAIIPATWLAGRLGGLRAPVYRHVLWCCCLVSICVLPLPRMRNWGARLAILPAHPAAAPAGVADASGPGRQEWLEAADTPQPVAAIDSPAALSAAPGRAAPAPASSQSVPVLIAAVAAAWAAGLAVLLARLAQAWVRLRRFYRSARPLAASLFDGLGSLPPPSAAVLVSNQLDVPVCIGILRPAVILPRNLLERGDRRELTMVLSHELAHVQRRDCLVNLLQRLFEAVFFFHPFAWLASRQLSRAREQICDNHVVLKGASPMDYARLLCRIVQSSAGQPTSAVALFEGGIVQRLRNLTDSGHPRLTGLGAARRLGWVCGVLAALALAGTVRLEARAAATAKPSSPATAPASRPATSPAEEEFTITTTTDADGRWVDTIEYPFRDDPGVIGTWKSVDFVRNMAAFKPGQKKFKDNLFLKEMTFLPHGAMVLPYANWTKGLVLHPGDRIASRYIIREMDGARYMFYEWKSGDYSIRHSKPAYYVLKHETADVGAAGKAWAALGGPDQWRREFAGKLAKLDIHTADLDQVKAALGGPGGIFWGNQTWPGDAPSEDLGEQFILQYPDTVSIFMRDRGKKIVELRYNKPGYFFQGVQVGSSLADVIKVVGKPDKTVDGVELTFEDGVHFKNIKGRQKGEGYYCRYDKGVRFWFWGDKVSAVYVVANVDPVEKWATRPGDPEWRRQFPDRLAHLEEIRDTADVDQIRNIFGAPGMIVWGDNSWRSDAQAQEMGDQFILKYPDNFDIYMVKGGRQIRELRYHRPGYPINTKIQVGAELADVIKAVGEPTKTIEGGENQFEDGVLYKDIKGQKGRCYYARADKNVRFFFADYRATAVYITNPDAQR